MEFIPVYLIFIPIIAAMFIYIMNNKHVNYLVFLAQSLVTILIIIYYKSFDGTIEKDIISLGGWDRAIGISLRNDKLSISFIFLTVFIWWMIILYIWDRRKEDFKFLFFLMFLEGTFLGLLQTNDYFNLFIFIEITTIISTILIIYKKDGYSVRSGLYYLLFNSAGMLFYLLGLILIYMVTGSLNMEVISEKIVLVRDTNVVKLSYVFMMAAVGAKSAFFPVYNWLPKAHGAAPASISALLSGLLIKSGIYAFIRINEIYRIDIFNEFFFILGGITAISGIVFALSQKDIKQILAFHTISQIGIILMGLSFIEGKSYMGGIMHIFNHSMFKSLLFLGSGVIINVYGTRKITEIRGVFKNLPIISIFMIIGMLSITGAPFFNGFVSKTIIKYGVKGNSIKTMLLYIINLGTSISFLKLSQIFFGHYPIVAIKDLKIKISMFSLALACVILGNWYIPILKGYFGVDISFINVFSINGWLNYIVTLIVGYFVYKWIIEKDYMIIRKIRHLNISFQTTNIMLVSFLFVMTIWIYIY